MYHRIVRFTTLLLILFCGQAVAGKTGPKNVIFIIGDGMGPNQVRAANIYRGNQNLSFENFPVHGTSSTNNYKDKLTDSAAAATAMATGKKVYNSVVSLNLPGDGSPIKTILEMAKDTGKSTGILTTTSFADATPAGFAAHAKKRKHKSVIVNSILKDSQPNIVFGASENIATDHLMAQNNHYRLLKSKTDLNRLDRELAAGMFRCTRHRCPRFFAGFGHHHFAKNIFSRDKDQAFPMAYENKAYIESHDLPKLKDMTKTALAVLEKNSKGFFLMIEGGLIDWIGHANRMFEDGDQALEASNQEVIELHNAVEVVDEWLKEHPDTLVIVTSDHETGGLELDAGATVCAAEGSLNCVVKQSWTSPQYKHKEDWLAKHTDTPVPVYAKGPGSELFSGEQDNTDFVPKILQAGFLN